MDNYTLWFDEWGSWDSYSPIVSDIDKDIEEFLLVYGPLFWEVSPQKKTSSSNIYMWIGVIMLASGIEKSLSCFQLNSRVREF
jgi:hypothetical protein